jgi:hypothetical protein
MSANSSPMTERISATRSSRSSICPSRSSAWFMASICSGLPPEMSATPPARVKGSSSAERFCAKRSRAMLTSSDRMALLA